MVSKDLYIKNMVCERCIKVIGEELVKLEIAFNSIELGSVELKKEPNHIQIEKISNALAENGFELIDDKRSQIIDRIKTLIIKSIYYPNELTIKTNISNHISGELGYDYSYLSNLFSSVEGTTIEKFIIYQKLEKVKELLVYDELSLSEISYDLNYSSVQHLSNQFKKYIGLSPSHFKKLRKIKRTPIDKV